LRRLALHHASLERGIAMIRYASADLNLSDADLNRFEWAGGARAKDAFRL
jgi:hypothetical protein